MSTGVESGHPSILESHVLKLGHEGEMARTLQEAPKLLERGVHIVFLERQPPNLNFEWVKEFKRPKDARSHEEVIKILENFPLEAGEQKEIILRDIEEILSIFPGHELDFIGFNIFEYKGVKSTTPLEWHIDGLTEKGVRVLVSYSGPSTQFTSQKEDIVVTPPTGTITIHTGDGKHRQPAFEPGMIRVQVSITLK